MARRWHFSLLVLSGLILTVAALWDNATASVVPDGAGVRTEVVGGIDDRDPTDSAPSELAFGDGNGSGVGDGDGANVLRPTTTTTRPPTTTSTTVAPTTSSTATSATPSTTTTTVAVDASATSEDPSGDGVGHGSVATVFEADFAAGSLIEGSWEVFDSGADGEGDGNTILVYRPSSVAVVPDPAATGGHVLALTAGAGSGDDADRIVSGGVRLLEHAVAHGRLTIRARLDSDLDESMAAVIRLRSVAGDWSSGDGHRFNVAAPVWQVYTAEWGPEGVTVTVDGGDPVTLLDDPAGTPQDPLELSIHLEVSSGGTADGQPKPIVGGRLFVDWIRIEDLGTTPAPKLAG